MRLPLIKSLGLAAILAAPLHADAITDFTALRGWVVIGCQMMDLSGIHDSGRRLATICISGPLVYGFRPTTNLYGFIYNFTTSMVGDVPPGAVMDANIEELDFENPRSPFIFHLLGPGEFFSPVLTENSTLTSGYAFTNGYAGPGSGVTGQDFDTRLAITPMPEPATFTLASTGVALMLAIRIRRRRFRRNGAEQDG